MQKPLDIIAISVSGVCLVHCLLTPVALVLFPILAGTLFASEEFHQYLIWVIIPTSIVAFLLGCRRHKDLVVMLTGTVGLLVLLSAVLWGHDVFGEWGERLLTLAGGILLIAGHVRNYQLCRNNHCDT